MLGAIGQVNSDWLTLAACAVIFSLTLGLRFRWSVAPAVLVIGSSVVLQWRTSAVEVALSLTFAFLVAALIRNLLRDRRRQEKLIASMQEQQRLEAEALVLEERARLARDLHDVLSHTLSATALQLERGRAELQDRADVDLALQRFSEAKSSIRVGMFEARRAVGALSGDQTDQPWDIENLIQTFAAATGIRCSYDHVTDASPSDHVEPTQAELLFRTVQEGLTNAVRHGAPTAIDIRLAAADVLDLSVDSSTNSPRTHSTAHIPDSADTKRTCHEQGAELRGPGRGLDGLRTRAERLGGRIESGPTDSGYLLRLVLPR